MKKLLEKHHFFTWLCCLILLLFMGILCIPDRVVTREQREQALQQQCINNLEKLAVICLEYAKTHNGSFPADIMQEKSASEILQEQSLLPEQDVVICPSTRKRFPASSYHFIPGITAAMSKKMPCVIEKITNHDRVLGVIHVDGTVRQIKHESQNYSALFPQLSEGLTEQEKQLLATHLKRLDIP